MALEELRLDGGLLLEKDGLKGFGIGFGFGIPVTAPCECGVRGDGSVSNGEEIPVDEVEVEETCRWNCEWGLPEPPELGVEDG